MAKTIKEEINIIKNLLDSSYSDLQTLSYQEEIEKFVRIRLLDMNLIINNLNDYIHGLKMLNKRKTQKIK